MCAGEDRRAGAARCLGELVRKMGERVLHRMLPILRDTMGSPEASTRQGVCSGLKEVRARRCVGAMLAPCAVLCCAVLCCAVLCCAVLCCAVLCCAVLCCAVLCCAVLCCGAG
jgi:hypothetical protein